MDEPAQLLRYLDRYSSALLGALLVDPSRAAGPEVAKLTCEDCHSELLSCVLTHARWRPAADASEVVRVALGVSCSSRDVIRALDDSFPWYADWYAFELKRLSESRRRFWQHLRAANREQFEMLREIGAHQPERQLALEDSEQVSDPVRPLGLDEF